MPRALGDLVMTTLALRAAERPASAAELRAAERPASAAELRASLRAIAAPPSAVPNPESTVTIGGHAVARWLNQAVGNGENLPTASRCGLDWGD